MMMTANKLDGGKLRHLRESMALTLFDVSMKCGVNPSTISKIENDKVKGVRFSTVSRIAKAFDMKPEVFLKKVEATKN